MLLLPSSNRHPTPASWPPKFSAGNPARDSQSILECLEQSEFQETGSTVNRHLDTKGQVITFFTSLLVSVPFQAYAASKDI